MRSVKDIYEASAAIMASAATDATFVDTVERIADAVVSTYRAGGRVFACGNGGSAADAQHLVAEFTGHYIIERPPLPAEALHANSSHMTAVANDYGYDEVFARALRANGRKGDILFAFTTSGNSRTVVGACVAARELGIATVALTGSAAGAIDAHADLHLRVPSTETGRIQEAHVVALHAISEHVETALFGH